eukprot:TRINITY_DN23637_c0_g1_i2.p1 TRINITY_DN23637_c0_g1~~TRINITY_DN23637_c0_g1_i2.p1  ORF type:complete len:140 (-),score=37.56 TRINITY_DN23637_c0_g1_i2:31-450(-)
MFVRSKMLRQELLDCSKDARSGSFSAESCSDEDAESEDAASESSSSSSSSSEEPSPSRQAEPDSLPQSCAESGTADLDLCAATGSCEGGSADAAAASFSRTAEDIPCDAEDSSERPRRSLEARPPGRSDDGGTTEAAID